MGFRMLSTADSPLPKIPILRLTRVPCLRESNQGLSSFSNILTISDGTPGIIAMLCPDSSVRISPGAVPRSFGRSIAPSGTIA